MKLFSRRTLLLIITFIGPSTVPAQEGTGVRPADVIDVLVLGQPSLSATFTIDAEGFIAYPLLGKVEVSGLEPEGVAARLQSLLGAGFIKKPEVSVRIKEYRSRPVMVLGEVVTPGIYPLKGDRSLLTMLGDAGGITGNAGHEVIVARPAEGRESAAIERFAAVPLVPGLQGSTKPAEGDELPPGALPGSDVFRAAFRELVKGNAEQNVILEGGDTVYVPPAAQIFVTGQAARPGNFKYVDGMTVEDVLRLVGGVSERGSMKRIKLIRFGGGKRIEVKAQLTDLLKPGDTVHIGERFF